MYENNFKKKIFNISFNYEFYIHGILSARVFVAAMDLPNGYDLVYIENRGEGPIPDEIMVPLVNRLKQMLDLDIDIMWVEKYPGSNSGEFDYYILSFTYADIELKKYKRLNMRIKQCPPWMIDYINDAINDPAQQYSFPIDDLNTITEV